MIVDIKDIRTMLKEVKIIYCFSMSLMISYICMQPTNFSKRFCNTELFVACFSRQAFLIKNLHLFENQLVN